jgi:hypothetical protein
VNPADCYHTGLVVEDMDAAARRLTAAMGYRWTKPLSGDTLSMFAYYTDPGGFASKSLTGRCSPTGRDF